MNKIITLIILIKLFTLIAFVDADTTDSKNLGKNLGKEIQETIGNKDSVNENLYKPLTTEAKMNTLKNTYKCSSNNNIYLSNEECSQNCSGNCSLNSFDAQIQCQSYVEGLVLQGLPGGGGELGGIIVKIDENFDQQYETIFNTFNVSGICTNGYVSCTTGTWDNCVFYEFGIKHTCTDDNVVYDTYRECRDVCPSLNCQSTGSVYQIPRNLAQMEKLGNCYCTNASCYMDAYNILDGILNTIGGGIVSHLINEKGLVISKTELDTSNMLLKYLVTDLVSCSDVNSNQKIKSLKQNYDHKILDGSSEVLTQINDPNSAYNLATKDLGDTNVHTCYIRNTPMAGTVNTVTDYRCSNPFYYNSKYYCEVWVSDVVRTGDKYENRHSFSGIPYLGSNGYKYEYFEHILFAQRVEDKSGSRCSVGWVNGNSPYHSNFSGVFPGPTIDDYVDCIESDWIGFYTDSYSDTVIDDGNMSITVYTNDSKANNTWVSSRLKMAITYDPKYKTESLQINENNGCLTYINDFNCKLRDEKVNDLFQTVYGGTPQQVSVPQSCVDVHGQIDDYRVCEGGDRFYQYDALTGQATNVKTYNDNIGYFKIRRTYECSNEKQEYDFSKAEANANLIGESYREETGDFNYLKTDNSMGSGNILIENEEILPECLLSCDVITDYHRDTILFPDNTLRNDTTNVNKETRECILDKVNNIGVCPTKNGEIIARNCGCVDRFSESISILSSVFQASRDMICSSYEP